MGNRELELQRSTQATSADTTSEGDHPSPLQGLRAQRARAMRKATDAEPAEAASAESESGEAEVSAPENAPSHESIGEQPAAAAIAPKRISAKHAIKRKIYRHNEGPDAGNNNNEETKDEDYKSTCEAFCSGTVPEGNAVWSYIENPAVWKGERASLHQQLLSSAKEEAQTFADTAQGEGQPPTLHAMRGNTAAGKSRAVRQNPVMAGPLAASPDAAANPDKFKPALMTAGGHHFTSAQVHTESSMLAWKLEDELKNMTTSDGEEPGTMVIDKRLATVPEVQRYAQMAKETNRKLSLHDVDAPLEVSLAGVLERQPGGKDPLPPFDIVQSGFTMVRGNRSAVIDLFKADREYGEYELYATKPDGTRVKIYSIKDGAEEVLDAELFVEVTADPGDAGALLGNKTIDEKAITDLTASLPGERGQTVANVLRPYIGQTWKHALDEHSKKKAEQ